MTDRIERFLDLAKGSDPTSLSGLTNAFAACLSYDEACEAVMRTFNIGDGAEGAVLNRLLRHAREPPQPKKLDRVADRLMAMAKQNTKARVHANAILWRLFDNLTVRMQRKVLKAWRADPRKDVRARWLKIVGKDTKFIDQVVTYWRESRDYRAAWVIAKHADPSFIDSVLSELMDHCDEGWIIGRAAIRASAVPPGILDRLKENFPPTYAYVCAKRGLPIPHEEALRLALAVNDQQSRHDRGLIIWAIGQLGMWDTLLEIRRQGSDIERRDTEAFYAAHGIKAHSGPG